jgi:hypothetical protein
MSGRGVLTMKPENLDLPQPASLQDQNVCNRQSFFLIRIAFIAIVFCLATAVASSGQSFTTVHSFIGDPSEGSAVYAPVIQATDGSVYGILCPGEAVAALLDVALSSKSLLQAR